MTYIEALVQSLKGKTIKSNLGTIYTPKQLQVERLGRDAYLSNSIVTKLEQKGIWEVLK